MFYNKKKSDGGRKYNAWKKYGALVMTGVLLAGTAAGTGAFDQMGTVLAEGSPKVGLNIAGTDAKEDSKSEVSGESQETSGEKSDETEAETRLALKMADADEAEKTDGDSGKETSQKEENSDKEDEKSDKKDEKSDEEDEKTEKEDKKSGEEDTKSDEESGEDDKSEEDEKSADGEKTYAEIAAVKTGEGQIVTTDVSAVVESCMPSIVSITNKSAEEIETYLYGTQEFEAESTASGIIVAQNEDELLIATNSHVVDGASELTVGFTVEAEDPEELIAPAKIKGMDRTYELAVVAVQLSDIPEEIREQLRIAELGSSEDLKVGEAAIAIGNALGYGQSVTCGIISALDREVEIDSFSKELIVTDASINYGNSGGALLNAKGQVIGINVAKEVADAAEGMGYSIPIDTAIPVLEELVNKETRDRLTTAERGYMGATVVNVSEDAKDLYNMPEGAFVYEVEEGSAADEAGIKKGDVITKFAGETVQSHDDLIDKIEYYAAGETVKLEVQTANNGVYEAREVEVTLQEADEDVIKEQQMKQESQESQEEVPDMEELPEEYGFPGGYELPDGSYVIPDDGSHSGWGDIFGGTPN